MSGGAARGWTRQAPFLDKMLGQGSAGNSCQQLCRNAAKHGCIGVYVHSAHASTASQLTHAYTDTHSAHVHMHTRLKLQQRLCGVREQLWVPGHKALHVRQAVAPGARPHRLHCKQADLRCVCVRVCVCVRAGRCMHLRIERKCKAMVRPGRGTFGPLATPGRGSVHACMHACVGAQQNDGCWMCCAVAARATEQGAAWQGNGRTRQRHHWPTGHAR